MEIAQMEAELATAPRIFKIPKEFVAEFGPNWRIRGWSSPKMDELFGKSTTLPEANHYIIWPWMWKYENPAHLQLAKELIKAQAAYIERVKITSANDEFGQAGIQKILYTTRNKNVVQFYVVNNPTGNCQLASIIYFNVLLDSCPIEEVKELFIHLRRNSGKAMYMFDVHRKYNDGRLQKLNLVEIHDYTSTNATLMTSGKFKSYTK